MLDMPPVFQSMLEFKKTLTYSDTFKVPLLKRAHGKGHNAHCVKKTEKLFEYRYSSTYIFSAVLGFLREQLGQ